MAGEGSERDPCPGCGRLIAYATRVNREPSDTARVHHLCPHKRPCVAFLSAGGIWTPGDAKHAERCVYCAKAAQDAAKASDQPPS